MATWPVQMLGMLCIIWHVMKGQAAISTSACLSAVLSVAQQLSQLGLVQGFLSTCMLLCMSQAGGSAILLAALLTTALVALHEL